MKYKAIIFDMDGTIINTEHVWVGATKKLLEAKGIALNAQDEQQLMTELLGLTCLTTCAHIKRVANLSESAEQLVEEFIMYAKNLYQDGIQFIRGFVEFHEKTQQHGLRTGIATNADDYTLHLARTALKLDSFFGTHIYNPSAVNSIGKPKPDLYLHVAEQLGIPAELCIAIEDSAHGIAAAQAAGMLCIGIGTSPDPKQIQHADITAQNYEEIMNHLQTVSFSP